jgi:ketosteroid isomerase-like protein
VGARLVELFREITDIYNSGDLEGFLQRFDSGIEFTPDPQWPEPGPFLGRDAFERFMRGWEAAWGRVTLHLEEVEQRGDDLVIARARWEVSGASSGADVPVGLTMVCWFGRDERVTRLAAFFDHADALRFAESA